MNVVEFGRAWKITIGYIAVAVTLILVRIAYVIFL